MNFVTFTRKVGTDGSEIARQVADQLHCRFYDTEAIESTAQEMGFLNDVKAVDEKMPSLFERFFSHRSEIYLDRLNSVIYELASRGDAVFLGRGTHVLLRTCALHVRVIASLEKRIENLVERGLQKEEAVRRIHKSDHERAAFIKFAFGVDWEDPQLYDLVLNMDNLTVTLAVNTVVHVAGSQEIKARSVEALSSLEMMGLVRRAEAALIEAGFSSTALSVSVPERGKVRVSGYVDELEEKEKAERALKRVKGVASIDNWIQIGQVKTKYPRGV